MLVARFSGSGQWERLWEAAQEWLGTDPQNARAHYAAGQALVNLSRYEEAEPHVTWLLGHDGENPVAHRLMSIVHLGRKRYRAAEESIQRAISLDPNDPYSWHHFANLCYQQGDLATAQQCAHRARELNPRDPNILNMSVLCEVDNPINAHQKIRGYQEALELDPENSNLHNNIGAQYINALKDYAAAEECFRRALFFDPTCRVARTNLFLALKHRDLVYRALCAPKDFLYWIASLSSHALKRSLFIYLLLLPVWLFSIRFVLVGLLLWCMLVWPLVKIYEYLVAGDIRARAGEIGARRGGFLGHRSWPLRVRLGLFALLLILFWSGLGYLARHDRDRDWLLGLLILAGAVVAERIVTALCRRGGARLRRWRRRKPLQRLLETKQPQRSRRSPGSIRRIAHE